MFFLTLFCALLLSSCISPFSRYYRPCRVPQIPDEDIIMLAPDAEPEILILNDLYDLYEKAGELTSNHYCCIGCSAFQSEHLSKSRIKKDITSQCKKVGATVAVINQNYSHKENIILPSFYFYNTYGQSTKTYSDGRYSYTQKHVQKTVPTFQIYNEYIYNYIAYYFAKFTTKSKFRLGIEYEDLNFALRKTYKRNQGVCVDMVYKDTPAFKKNILIGDIIIKINNQNINNTKDMDKIMTQLKSGDLLKIELQREYKIQTVELKLD